MQSSQNQPQILAKRDIERGWHSWWWAAQVDITQGTTACTLVSFWPLENTTFENDCWITKVHNLSAFEATVPQSNHWGTEKQKYHQLQITPWNGHIVDQPQDGQDSKTISGHCTAVEYSWNFFFLGQEETKTIGLEIYTNRTFRRRQCLRWKGFQKTAQLLFSLHNTKP